MATMKRRVRKPKLMKYGYWNYPDPTLTIAELLKNRPSDLAAFNAALEEDLNGSWDAVQGWGTQKDLPIEVRRLVRKVADANSEAEHFDEVEVATGIGADMGGMCSGCASTLTARRRNGLIIFGGSSDLPFEAPEPSTAPLALEDVFDIVAGDFAELLSISPETIQSCLDSGTPSREDVEEALEPEAWCPSVFSDFYDFTARLSELEDGVREEVLTRYGLDDERARS